MKKILILVLAIVIAGAAFAETDPAFSGSFSTEMGYSFQDKKINDGMTDSMKLNLNATIDEWNTVSVSVGLAEALYWNDGSDNSGDFNVSGGATKATGISTGAGVGLQTDYLRMDEFTLTSDLFGALGVNGPVGLTLKLGKFGFGAKPGSIANVAPKSMGTADGTDDGTGSNVGIQVDLKILDMITLSSVLYPSSLKDVADKVAPYEGGVILKGTGIADIMDVSLYFISSAYNGDLKYPVNYVNEDAKDDPSGRVFGAAIAFNLADGAHKIGAGFQYDIEPLIDDKIKAQLDYALKMGKVTAGLSVGLDGTKHIVASIKPRLSLLVELMENFSVFGAVGIDGFKEWDSVNEKYKDFDGNRLKYDVGLTTALGALGIQFGMTNDLDYKAPADDWGHTLYLKFSTSF
ncbi:MAG: hypothetical protein B0D92_08090 [Spirochaeta sp. LUC14_002_19_P3]|nr:MAG: hypothetical protein B0D92_08090 [Spirochaeta sp. LUC14_002_19_P3]